MPIDIRTAFLDIYQNPLFAVVLYKIIIVVGIAVAVHLVVRLILKLVNRFVKKHTSALQAAGLLRTIVSVVVWSVGALVILQTLGIAVAPILTALGVGGLAIALAAQDTFSNLFAGIHLILSRQIKVGDQIEVDADHKGKVLDVLWRYTIIEASSKERVIIPNAKLAQAIIRKFTA